MKIHNIILTQISIHAPARGATAETYHAQVMRGDFNPRSRKGSDSDDYVHPNQDGQFQSTLPQGERQNRGLRLNSAEAISIHAPARGATTHSTKTRFGQLYFNPRSRKGSDYNGYLKYTNSKHFNPRSRKGSDRSSSVLFCMTLDFNPRSRKGSDLARRTGQTPQNIFQSTLPQGERRL